MSSKVASEQPGLSLASLYETLSSALPSGWKLREEQEQDLPFLSQLYASTREDELAPVPWSAEEKKAFLADQFQLQHQHYRLHYANAGFWVIYIESVPVGRIYLHLSDDEVRLMDIALITGKRGLGIGSHLIKVLQAEAAEYAHSISLHVEPSNPAIRLYSRLGFVKQEQRGAYWFMTWKSQPG